MKTDDADKKINSAMNSALSRRARFVLFILVLFAAAILWSTNTLLTDRFTQTTKNRAELRLALYGNNLVSETQRNAIVPQLLARDPVLIGALNSKNYSQTTQRLISYIDEIGALNLVLFDSGGRVVAATNRNQIGEIHRQQPYFVSALRSSQTLFTLAKKDTGDFGFYYSRQITDQNQMLGVIMVEVDLQKFQVQWSGISDSVMVTDSKGIIILSTEISWRGKTIEQALADQPPETTFDRAIRIATDWTIEESDIYVEGQAVLQLQGRIPFQGWQITSFTAYSSVREQVNAILAFEIMFFALFFAAGFYVLNRRNLTLLSLFQRESAELRVLNARLEREVEERIKVQKTLKVTEQSLAQSSKLAVLGEMSAAVSHELNQPLAAMKTYLAGATLLIKRNRPDEAIVAFDRINSLIERMGAITRQLKSYARKGGEEFKPVDMSHALESALAIMEPQLKQTRVHLTRVISTQTVYVMGDRLRIEQVLINLIKNAVDACKASPNPEIEVMITVGKKMLLSVRDNGIGISDLDNLFEPFHTTKQPGEGTGLGLAISSGIISDLGGRLTARNAPEGGAIFEIELPLFNEHGQRESISPNAAE